MNTTAIVNGVMFSWANVSLILFGTVVRGVKNVKYSYSQEKKNVYGYGTEPIGRTYGNIEYQCEITLLKDEVQSIVAAAKSNGLNKITDIAPFYIDVMYGQNPAGGLNPAPQAQGHDQLQYCEFLDLPFEGKQNDQEFEITLKLIVGGVAHIS